MKRNVKENQNREGAMIEVVKENFIKVLDDSRYLTYEAKQHVECIYHSKSTHVDVY